MERGQSSQQRSETTTSKQSSEQPTQLQQKKSELKQVQDKLSCVQLQITTLEPLNDEKLDDEVEKLLVAYRKKLVLLKERQQLLLTEVESIENEITKKVELAKKEKLNEVAKQLINNNMSKFINLLDEVEHLKTVVTQKNNDEFIDLVDGKEVTPEYAELIRKNPGRSKLLLLKKMRNLAGKKVFDSRNQEFYSIVSNQLVFCFEINSKQVIPHYAEISLREKEYQFLYHNITYKDQQSVRVSESFCVGTEKLDSRVYKQIQEKKTFEDVYFVIFNEEQYDDLLEQIEEFKYGKVEKSEK
jgi:hypothetical protein